MENVQFRRAGVWTVIAILCLTLGLTAVAAPPNTFITPPDLDGAGFWTLDFFDTDGAGTASNPSSAIVNAPVGLADNGMSALNLKPGDGYTPAGSGCTRLGGKAFFGTKALDGLTLNEITSFSFSYLGEVLGFYSGAPGVHNSTMVSPYVNIFVDRNGDGDWYGVDDTILIYEPIYTRGNSFMVEDTWFTDHAIGSGATGNWHTAGAPIAGVGVGSPLAPNDTWAEIMAVDLGGGVTVGDLPIVNPIAGCDDGDTLTSDEGTGSGFVILAGQKSGDLSAGASFFIDGVELQINSDPVQTANLTLSQSFTADSGSGQTTEAGFLFDAPLVVTLLDTNGAPIAGETVVFTSTSVGGASATFPITGGTALTDANGQVRLVVAANATPGSYTVTAAADGRTATFSLTSVAAPSYTSQLVLPQQLNDTADFWQVDYYDNDPANSPEGSLAMNPPSVVNPLLDFGTSSFQMLTGSGLGGSGACGQFGGKVFLGTTQLEGVKLKDIKGLGYAFLFEDTSLNLLYSPYVNIYVDLNNDGVWTNDPGPTGDSILVYDAVKTDNVPGPGTRTANTWYETTAIGPSSTAHWARSTHAFAGIPNINPAATESSWNEILAKPYGLFGIETVGDLKVVNPTAGCDNDGVSNGPADDEGTGSGFSIKIGQKNGGSYNDSDAHVDKVSLYVEGVLAPTTFDFALFGPAASIEVVGGSEQEAALNTAFGTPLSVLVKDASGNPVIGEVVQFSAPNSGASLVFTPANGQATTNASGVATITATANSTLGSYEASATINALSPVTFALTNVQGTAANIAKTGGDNQSAEISTAFAAPLEVTVTDAFGNPVSGVTVVFTAVPAAGASAVIAPVGGSATTDALGKASVTATANTVAGGYTVTAVAGALNTTFALTNTAGAGVNISKTSGDNQIAEVTTAFAAPLEVTIADSSGNPVSGVTVVFTAVPAAGASADTTPVNGEAVTDALGKASVTATANTVAGSYTVTAVAGGLNATFTLTNTAGEPVAMTKTGGDNQTAGISTAFAAPLEVLLTDAFGNPVSGVAVTFAAPGSGSSAALNPANGIASSNAAGKASVTATANALVGSYSVTATVDALNATFSLTNTLDGAIKLVKVSGNDQHATINTAFAAPLVVRVTDLNGTPIEGVTVQFAVLTRAASAIFTPSNGQAVTDGSGNASISVAADSQIGTYDVMVVSSVVFTNFTLTNDPLAAVAPTDFNATATGQTTASLTWTDTAGAAESVQVMRSSDGGATFSVAATLSETATSYADTGLVCGTAYVYKLRVSNVVFSADSNTDSITTTACTELLVNGGFEAPFKGANKWKAANSTGDKRACEAAPLNAYEGACWLTLTGSASESSSFTYKVPAANLTALTAGDTLFLSAAYKTTAGKPRVTVFANVKINGVVTKHRLQLNTTSPAYSVKTLAIGLNGTPSAITIIVKNQTKKGRIFVDAVSLTLNDATRMSGAEAANGILPPPAAPDNFRGSN